MSAQSVFFCNFKLLNQLTTEELVESIFKIEVNDSEDRFVLNEYDNRIIDGYYVISYVFKELTYNYLNNSFETVDVKRTLAISFSIDLEKEMIDIWSNKSNASKLMTALALSLNNKVVMESINISFSHIVQRMQKGHIQIGKVKVENIVFENNIIASCIFDLTNHDKPYSVLEKYKKDIIQISAVLKDNSGEAVTITVYSTGSIVIYKSKEQLSPELLNKIKEISIGAGR